MSVNGLQTKFVGAQKKFDGDVFSRFLASMPTKEKPIHFIPTPQTASVIATIKKSSRAGKGPIVRAAMDFVASQIRNGKLEFVELQLISKQ